MTRRWLGEATNLGRYIELPSSGSPAWGYGVRHNSGTAWSCGREDAAGRMRGRRQQALRGGGVEAAGQHRAGEGSEAGERDREFERARE